MSLADVQPRVAAAVSGAIDQAGGLAFAYDVDAGSVRGELARAEIVAIIGAQLAAVSVAPVDREPRIQYEVRAGEGFGARGEADLQGGYSCSFIPNLDTAPRRL